MFLAIVLAAAAASPCSAAQTQMDLDQCWSARAKQADTDLNATYARVNAGLRKLGVSAQPLVGIQLAWIGARDATCAFEASLSEGGSISPMIQSQCIDTMTRDRTARLSAFLDVMIAEGYTTKAAPVSAATDKELNRVYGLFMKHVTPAQQKALVKAEVAWLAYRDKACAAEGGTCLTDLEKERIAILESGWMGEAFW